MVFYVIIRAISIKCKTWLKIHHMIDLPLIKFGDSLYLFTPTLYRVACISVLKKNCNVVIW